MSPSADPGATAIHDFREVFDDEPEAVVVAPGRVNLIGDHTDYNEGFVLPMAIDRALAIAFRRRSDPHVRVRSFGELAAFSIDPPSHGEPAWSEYVRGVTWAHRPANSPTGWDATIASTIPAGASLSSSAAIEVATALVLDHVAGVTTDRTDLAIASQRAERAWVGMDCGIMDQLTVARAAEGHALLIDCRTLETRDVPLPDDLVILVLDTGTRRSLTDSPYNDRRAACERVAAALGIGALRDLDLVTLETRASDLDPVDARRARHVVTENRRVLDAVDALRADDAVRFGSIMTDSHRSLRDDFESSSPELDAMVASALAAPGCHGARVTGAGFAGCAVAAVTAGDVENFVEATSEAYQTATGRSADLYVCRAAEAATITPLGGG